MNTPHCAILGLGFLGRPLAEQVYQSGAQVAAVKKRLTSDDINLPIALQFADLDDAHAAERVYATWQDYPTWLALLPPSSVADYVAVIAQWTQAAQQYGVQHLVFASSISVYGTQARQCDENSVLAPDTESARKLVAAEQIVLNSGIAHIDVLRLGGLYAAMRHPLYRLLQQTVVQGANHTVNMVHQERALAVLLRVLHNPNGIRIRNIAETAHPNKRDFYTQEAQKLGLACPNFRDDGGVGKTVTTCYADFFDILS